MATPGTTTPARKRPMRRAGSGGAGFGVAAKAETERRSDEEPGGRRRVPSVRDQERAEEEGGEAEEDRPAERRDVELRARPLAGDEEEDGEEAEEQREGEDVGVEVREEEAPERELVDLVLVLQDARDGPEEVEVDRPPLPELDEPGEVPGEETEEDGPARPSGAGRRGRPRPRRGRRRSSAAVEATPRLNARAGWTASALAKAATTKWPK